MKNLKELVIDIYKKEIPKKDGSGKFPIYLTKTILGWGDTKIKDAVLKATLQKGTNKVRVKIDDIGIKTKTKEGQISIDKVFITTGVVEQYTAEELAEKAQARAEKIVAMFE